MTAKKQPYDHGPLRPFFVIAAVGAKGVQNNGILSVGEIMQAHSHDRAIEKYTAKLKRRGFKVYDTGAWEKDTMERMFAGKL